MQLFTYRITGVSPILQNNPAAMGKGKSNGLAAKKVYVPEEEAEAAVYRNEAGEIIVPTIAFRSSMLRASTGRKIGKSAAKSVLSGSVFPAEQQCILLDPQKEKPLKNYKIHQCRAVVNKAGIIRTRPMIERWMTYLVLEVDTEMLPNVEIVTQVLNIAGKIVGVMDWRPEKLGIYGRFTAELKA